MKKFLISLGVVIVIIIVIVILRKDSNSEDQNFVVGEAMVSEVELSLLESFPVGVSASVSGSLSDSCTQLGDVIQNRDENGDFVVTLQTKRPVDEVCAQVLSDFETNILIQGTDGLVAGDYDVVVNGVRETFTFEVDNFISDFDPLK